MIRFSSCLPSKSLKLVPGVSKLRPMDCMRSRVALNAAQHKIINLFKTLWDTLWLSVTMFLKCGPRQLFFFQGGAETPKVGHWTPLPQKHCTIIHSSTLPVLANMSFQICHMPLSKLVKAFLGPDQKIVHLSTFKSSHNSTGFLL